MASALAWGWETAAGMLAVLTPLVTVPLTVITFYLRSMREAQTSTQTQTARRIERLEGAIEELQRRVGQFERDYTTKEEWIRETMLARHQMERLGETVVRVETEHALTTPREVWDRRSGRSPTGRKAGPPSAETDSSAGGLKEPRDGKRTIE